ncbi:GL20222 [Drosophila persimilis]|uniref:GL20222 n=1 Tax=Drosophila persimilis TaxID=7234 RepID=B4GXR2_DROPE|nr:GL20222 [Drosophila persimilis]
MYAQFSCRGRSNLAASMDIDDGPEPSCSKRSNGNDPADDKDNEMSVKRSRPDDSNESVSLPAAPVTGVQVSALDYEMQPSSAAAATGIMAEAESQPQEQQQEQQQEQPQEQQQEQPQEQQQEQQQEQPQEQQQEQQQEQPQEQQQQQEQPQQPAPLPQQALLPQQAPLPEQGPYLQQEPYPLGLPYSIVRCPVHPNRVYVFHWACLRHLAYNMPFNDKYHGRDL